MAYSKPFWVTLMSLRSPVPVCSNLTRPSLGENVRAESMLTVQTVLPLPLAGETVIHGSWVLATHESPLERENSTVLPSAPASIRSSGAEKPTEGSLLQESSRQRAGRRQMSISE